MPSYLSSEQYALQATRAPMLSLAVATDGNAMKLEWHWPHSCLIVSAWLLFS